MITAQNIVGTPTDSAWAQVQKIERDGQTVVLVLTLSAGEESGATALPAVGGAVCEKFHEHGGVKRDKSEWYEWTQAELGELEGTGLIVSVLIACIEGDRAWMWGSGRTGATLYRGGRMARIAGDGEWGMGVEGELIEGDGLILGTSEAIEVVITEQASLPLPDAEGSVAALSPQVHATNSALLGLSIIQAKKQGEEIKPFWTSKLPTILVKRKTEDNSRFNMKVGGVVGVVMLLLVIVGIVRRVQISAEQAYGEVTSRSTQMLSEARSVAESNPERAKILLSQSRDTLQAYIETQPKAEYEKRAKEQLVQLESESSEILRVKGIALSPTVELGVIADGLTASVMNDDAEGTITFWDERSKNLVGINVADLSTVRIEVSGVRYVSPFSVSEGVYTGMSEGGVWVGDEGGQEVVIPTDETWGKITAVATYGSNIYLLDTLQGEIWKYAAAREGYAERRRWFGAGIVLDLSRIVDWVVDGDVWLLSGSGKVERYSRGVPVAFNLTGFPSEGGGGLISPVALAVTTERVYVLEQGASRVVVFDKEGKYLAQYVAEDFGKASDLVVYEDKGYVLVENVIKEWGL